MQSRPVRIKDDDHIIVIMCVCGAERVCSKNRRIEGSERI